MATVNSPEELQAHDRIGPYLNFMQRTDGGYLFFETCGLAHVILHWQTVNWMLKTIGVTRHAQPVPVSSCCGAEIREDGRCASCKDGTGPAEEGE